MKTYSTKKKDIQPVWRLYDAENKILGRMASQISTFLMGKNRPYYSPHQDCGDHVVVINAKKFVVTGGKEKKKVYYRHSGYPGGLKQETLGKLLASKPEEVIKRAVSGMLPKNKLRSVRLRKLHIYRNSEHPHKGQIRSVKRVRQK